MVAIGLRRRGQGPAGGSDQYIFHPRLPSGLHSSLPSLLCVVPHTGRRSTRKRTLRGRAPAPGRNQRFAEREHVAHGRDSLPKERARGRQGRAGCATVAEGSGPGEPLFYKGLVVPGSETCVLQRCFEPRVSIPICVGAVLGGGATKHMYFTWLPDFRMDKFKTLVCCVFGLKVQIPQFTRLTRLLQGTVATCIRCTQILEDGDTPQNTQHNNTATQLPAAGQQK